MKSVFLHHPSEVAEVERPDLGSNSQVGSYFTLDWFALTAKSEEIKVKKCCLLFLVGVFSMGFLIGGKKDKRNQDQSGPGAK